MERSRIFIRGRPFETVPEVLLREIEVSAAKLDMPTTFEILYEDDV